MTLPTLTDAERKVVARWEELVAKGRDPYRAMAAEFYGKPVADVTQNERNRFKLLSYVHNYSVSGHGEDPGPPLPPFRTVPVSSIGEDQAVVRRNRHLLLRIAVGLIALTAVAVATIIAL